MICSDGNRVILESILAFAPKQNVTYALLRNAKGPPLSAWIIQQQPIQSQYTQTFVAMVNDTFKQQIITRIAVIGAGPSGLAAAKALLDEGTFQKIVVFERNAEIGGTWIYSPEVNPQPPIPSVDVLEVDPPESKNIILSPIYDALHTNLPHPVMAYRDFPFPKDTPLFPSHDLVLAYLRLFAKHFQLETMIRFHSCVTRAERLSGGWVLSIEDATHRYVETFDAVIVATGHYSIPHIPDIEGLKETNIEIMHSREYRRADTFRDKVICVVGAGSSGVDIVRETSKTARKVYHSVRNRLDPSSVQQARSDNLIEIGSIRSVRLNRIESDDGVFNVDVLIFATGYLRSHIGIPLFDHADRPISYVTDTEYSYCTLLEWKSEVAVESGDASRK
ncbi:hypothetical protein EC973_004765 [Apophysomyces ossiformis]|uniref:FAD/NAD(P)-binding domain-containing protein n=1 Tax=Apophysomyces ossiformis TaxID=679940 RepID=A0A8H7BWV9_9FUNG|nr:hypothetical protein EC973_004765 [Apophysomyces ossiformis]